MTGVDMRQLSLAILVALTAALLAPAAAPAAAAPAARPGLATRTVREGDRALLAVTSAGRFELRLDEGGIAAWYDLRRDPGRARNLVTPGLTLVAHAAPDGAPLRAPWRLEQATPVFARVSWRGPGFARAYTIWAAGQVQIVAEGEAAPMRLVREPGARPGAALQPAGPGVATLFLDAWTGEDLPATLAWSRAAPPAALGVHLSAVARDGAATIVVPPDMGLRAPRLAVAGWPGPAHTLRQGDALLVEGQDYLAHWDAATGTLYAQVLAGLPPRGDPAQRTFSFLQQTTPSLSLGVEGRTLSPEGLLLVDGNMPDRNGNASTYDLFYIPYIQATPEITLTGVFQGPGAGVEFVLNGESRKVFGAPGSALAASFSLPAFGDYRAEGYIIDAAGARLGAAPDDTIEPVSLGRIILTIGDSITAGAAGDEVRSDSPSYPIARASLSPAASQDGRNFYQYENSDADGAAFRRGYQLTLNNLLTACSAAPVFILNEGFDGLTLTNERDHRPPARPGDRSAIAKIAAYRDHIEQLGARHVLITLGSNDVRDGRAVSWFRDDLRELIVGLWGDDYGLNIWLTTVPWTTFPGVRPELLADRQKRILDYNREIAQIATMLSSRVRPVRLGPDFYAHFQNQPELLADGLHPSQAGYESMAQLWAAPSGVGVGTLPCRAFAEEGQAPPPPLNLTPRVWLPLLATLRVR